MEILAIVPIILIVAFVLGEIFKRIGLPPVVGQILAGLIFGLPFLKNIFFDNGSSLLIIDFLATLGILLLLFLAGLEIDIEQIKENSKDSVLIALGTVIVPFVFGFLFISIFFPQYGLLAAIIFGGAMMVTSEGTKVKVLMDLNSLNTRLGAIMKISVIIPAYNEGPRIGGVLEGMPGGVDEVVVVDDGSEDDTGRIARAMGARVVRHEKNQGKGSAIKTGIRESKNDVLVFMDGDGQHDPRYITKIVKPLLRDEADVAIGNRFHNGFSGTPIHRIISNTLTRNMINIITGERVEDPLSGYRAITRGTIEGLRIDRCGFEIEIELILQAIERGYRISYIDVPLIYGVKRSHLRNLDSIKITLRLINAFVRYRLWGL